jgi:hypothetical protein
VYCVYRRCQFACARVRADRFSDTVTAFFGTVGICSVSVLLIVVSPGRAGLSLLAMEVFVERR